MLKPTTLAAVLAALFLAGCGGPPAPTVAELPPAPLDTNRGIDLATDSSDVLNEIRDSRVGFVARYYRDPASRWPALSATEARRLSALGLKIVTVWEWHSGRRDYFSYASGYGDGLSAYREAYAVGQPAGSAIYFGVDFNANAADIAQIDQYFRGVAAAFAVASGGRGGYKIGVYGSGAVCDAVKRAGLAQYSWLSNALNWAGALTYNDWDIRQTERLGTLSFDHDGDEAKPDFGGFSLARYAGAVPHQAASVDAGLPKPAAQIADQTSR